MAEGRVARPEKETQAHLGGLSLALAVGTAEYLPREIYNVFINVTYIAIFFTVLVQGLSVGNVYRRLEKHKLARQKRAKQ